LDELAAIQICHEGRLLVRGHDVNLRAVTTDSLFAWHPLTPRVSLVGGNGANSVVIADGRDVLLVDTKETGFGGALRAEVEHVVGRPVTCVVSTHHHTDHVMGNPAFTADVPVIAQRRARERTLARAARALVEMATAVENGADPFEAHVADLRDWAQYYDGHVRLDDSVRLEFESLVERASDAVRGVARGSEQTAAVAPIAERFAPTETFESEHALRVGGVEVELHHWGPGHTDGDVVVVLPSEGIVVAADLVYVGLQPFIDAGAGGRTDEWMRRTDELLNLCGRLNQDGPRAIVVPGHGAPAGADAVVAQRGYFERLRGAVGEALQAGRSRTETLRLVPAGLPAERAELLGTNLGLVFDELDQAPAGAEEFSCQSE
jgi:glyoxylase-like metal-dependent hydrolase (beta-lactamase superfamily II)